MCSSFVRQPVLLVTGASRGIGRAIAEHAGRRGYAVCVNYLRAQDQAEAVVEAIRSNGGTAVAVQADIGDPQSVDRLFAETAERLGPLTALVNNAGEIPSRQDFSTMDDDDIDRLVSVNFTGAMRCMRRAIAQFRETGVGAIVNVSSEAARFGGNRLAVYAATKAALSMLTVSTARELAPLGIRVNAVSPGTILTDALAAEGEEVLEGLKRTLPMGRLGTTVEAAATVLWLLSDEASYVSGAVVPISGGR
ncbi:MAG: SDR family NAD(P)-dependent oxidoreductase [Thalassobaculum sp.]|jgi:NAD(P)-dependent dehydrogenase (short-subunit alcohol dehydrogenase family)